MILIKNDKIVAGYIPTFKVASRSIVKSINDFEENNEIKIINNNNTIAEINSDKNYVFTFVRNPVDRFLSSYYFTKEHHTRKVKSINDFLKFLEHEKIWNLNVHRKIGFVLNHCVPLTNFLLKDGEIDKNLKIYKYENLNTDWSKVMRRINTLFKPENKLTKLEHLNKTKKRNKNIKLTEKQLNTIYKLYEKDFKNFDYELNPIST